MTAAEVFDRILIDSGAFLFSQQDIELDITKFTILINRVLAIYSKYSPDDRMIMLTSVGSTHEFVEPIPKWISDVTPVFNTLIFNQAIFPTTATSQKTEFVWKYVKPTLYLPAPGNYNVVAVYTHTLDTISDDDYLFFRILAGMFLQTLGRNRRAFTLTELPINMDAADLVSEGVSMVEEGMRALQEVSSKFYLAYG